MIKTTIFIKENMLFSILKLPFVQKVEMNHMSKQSRTVDCTYRVSVILKDKDNFKKQLITCLSLDNLSKIDDTGKLQQLKDAVLELEQTGKLKNKNFKNICEIAKEYNLQIPNKKQYQQQIEIIKSLSVKV